MTADCAQILEYVDQRRGELQIDREAAVVRGVKVLGLTSQNGREYLSEAVKRALPLYEGVAVNVDHPARPGDPVPVSRRMAWLENVRQDADGGARADLHLLKSHPTTAIVLEVAERRPQLLGLSHNVSGRVVRKNGRDVVEAIERVHSVDLVADPATVKGLHEAREAISVTRQKPKVLAEELKTQRPGYARGLLEMAEAGLLGGDLEMEAPAEANPAPSESKDHEQALKDGFRAAVMAVLDDDTLDLRGKLKKIRDVLRAEEKLLGGNGDSGDAGTEEKDKAMTAEESTKLRAINDGLCQLLEVGIKLDPVARKALDGCTSKADVDEVVKLIKEHAVARSAASGARSAAVPPAKQITEQKKGQALEEMPTDRKELAAWLKRR